MSIEWTKDWSGADNGTTLNGVDLKNIQDDLSGVLQSSDIGVSVASQSDLDDALQYNNTCYDNEVVCYNNNVVYY